MDRYEELTLLHDHSQLPILHVKNTATSEILALHRIPVSERAVGHRLESFRSAFNNFGEEEEGKPAAATTTTTTMTEILAKYPFVTAWSCAPSHPSILLLREVLLEQDELFLVSERYSETFVRFLRRQGVLTRQRVRNHATHTNRDERPDRAAGALLRRWESDSTVPDDCDVDFMESLGIESEFSMFVSRQQSVWQRRSSHVLTAVKTQQLQKQDSMAFRGGGNNNNNRNRNFGLMSGVDLVNESSVYEQPAAARRRHSSITGAEYLSQGSDYNNPSNNEDENEQDDSDNDDDEEKDEDQIEQEKLEQQIRQAGDVVADHHFRVRFSDIYRVPMTDAQVRLVLFQLLSALATLHSRGLAVGAISTKNLVLEEKNNLASLRISFFRRMYKFFDSPPASSSENNSNNTTSSSSSFALPFPTPSLDECVESCVQRHITEIQEEEEWRKRRKSLYVAPPKKVLDLLVTEKKKSMLDLIAERKKAQQKQGEEQQQQQVGGKTLDDSTASFSPNVASIGSPWQKRAAQRIAFLKNQKENGVNDSLVTVENQAATRKKGESESPTRSKKKQGKSPTSSRNKKRNNNQGEGDNEEKEKDEEEKEEEEENEEEKEEEEVDFSLVQRFSDPDNLMHWNDEEEEALVSAEQHFELFSNQTASNQRFYEREDVKRWLEVCYQSPEEILQITDHPSPAADIWSVAIVALELLSARPIVFGTSERDRFFRCATICGSPAAAASPDFHRWCLHVTHTQLPSRKMRPTPLKSIVPLAGEQVTDLLSKLLVLDPAKRLTAAEALEHPFFS